MKKVFLLLLAATFVCGAAMGQEQEKKKKKGGFMNVLKKGVESATGLDVSKETLFVYPEIGVWKMTILSCVGDPATGTVKIAIGATRLTGGDFPNAWCLIREAVVTGSTKQLQKERRSADPFYNFKIGQMTEIDGEDIYGVPTDAKSLDIKFYIDDRAKMIEARDVPILWQAAE